MQQYTGSRDEEATVSTREGDTLSAVDMPARSAEVVLASGRRYELEAGAEADRLTVRGRGGQVVLRIQITDRGPVLSFSSAEIELSAARELRLTAERVSIAAKGSIEVESGGALTERVGSHHTQVAGEERLEAASVEMQANEGHLRARARRSIALDADHIGLNDEPLPGPFDWSAPAREELQ